MSIKKNITTGNESLDNSIDDLVRKYFDNDNLELIKIMFSSVAKIGLESSSKRDLKLFNSTLRELRNAFKILSEFRDTRKVVIFGSARTPVGCSQYKITEEFAKKIVKKGFLILTGAGNGIMEAGNKGAGTKKSFGINIDLPNEQGANEFIYDDYVINFRYFFTRKLIFLKESDATLLLPGGFGTLDEGLEALTLVQTGKTKPRPIVLLEPEGETYWENFLKFIDSNLLREKYISKSDFSLFTITNNIDDAVQQICDFYSTYHSVKYLSEKIVMRFNKKLPEELIDSLNDKFNHILVDGKISACGPAEIEIERDDNLDKPRIQLKFNYWDFGGLIEMIKYINKSMSHLQKSKSITIGCNFPERF